MDENIEETMAELCKCGHTKFVHGITGGEEHEKVRPLGSCGSCECNTFH